MKLQDVLEMDMVFADLKSTSKEGVIREMTGELAKKLGVDTKRLVRAIMEREKLKTTAIGEGIAVPHIRAKGIDQVRACFGRSTCGIDFKAKNGKPSYFFFLILAPENSAGEHLKILARIARLCKNGDFLERIGKAGEAKEIYQIIVKEEQKL